MRLRKKPWIDTAIREFSDFVYVEDTRIKDAGKEGWARVFGRESPLYVELGSGKGRFVSQMAARHPEVDFIGVEAQQDVLYYAALKTRELELTNVRLLVFDIHQIEDIFADGEVDRFFINFCDPWPKSRHAKRRLTHVNFLEKYRKLLSADGALWFKTDNRPLFDFSLQQFALANLRAEQITYDLHQNGMEDNIMTEYEAKFSALGEKINRCEVSFG